MSRRAQTFTLEAFVAAILLLATIAFALQVVSVSSNTAGAGGTETRNHQAGLAEGVLDESAADGTLEETLLYWDEGAGEFYDADDEDGGFYVARHPPTGRFTADSESGFGESLESTFDDRQVRYNVDLYFESESGDLGHQRLVESGTPSADAVRITETVTLYDDTRLLNDSGVRQAELATVDDDPDRGFYAPDVGEESPLYNVVRVEVVLWWT